jgi:hypothetical protein
MKPKPTPHAAVSPREEAAGASRHARRSRVGLEITVVLCVKVLLLLLLREVWFSHPPSKHLTERGVAAALFGPVNGPLPREERPDGSGH